MPTSPKESGGKGGGGSGHPPKPTGSLKTMRENSGGKTLPLGCPTVRGSDTGLILIVLPNFCPLFGFDTM